MMKRGFSLFGKKVHIGIVAVLIVAVAVVVGIFLFGVGLSGNVVKDIEGNDISVATSLTQEQLAYGIVLYGESNMIRWVDDARHEVRVNEVFDQPGIVYVWSHSENNIKDLRRWYGYGYSVDGNAAVKNADLLHKGILLEVLVPGHVYGVKTVGSEVLVTFQLE